MKISNRKTVTLLLIDAVCNLLLSVLCGFGVAHNIGRKRKAAAAVGVLGATIYAARMGTRVAEAIDEATHEEWESLDLDDDDDLELNEELDAINSIWSSIENQRDQ